jgi:hypothetical protein
VLVLRLRQLYNSARINVRNVLNITVVYITLIRLFPGCLPKGHKIIKIKILFPGAALSQNRQLNFPTGQLGVRREEISPAGSQVTPSAELNIAAQYRFQVMILNILIS